MARGRQATLHDVRPRVAGGAAQQAPRPLRQRARARRGIRGQRGGVRADPLRHHRGAHQRADRHRGADEEGLPARRPPAHQPPPRTHRHRCAHPPPDTGLDQRRAGGRRRPQVHRQLARPALRHLRHRRGRGTPRRQPMQGGPPAAARPARRPREVHGARRVRGPTRVHPAALAHPRGAPGRDRRAVGRGDRAPRGGPRAHRPGPVRQDQQGVEARSRRAPLPVPPQDAPLAPRNYHQQAARRQALGNQHRAAWHGVPHPWAEGRAGQLQLLPRQGLDARRP